MIFGKITGGITLTHIIFIAKPDNERERERERERVLMDLGLSHVKMYQCGNKYAEKDTHRPSDLSSHLSDLKITGMKGPSRS